MILGTRSRSNMDRGWGTRLALGRRRALVLTGLLVGLAVLAGASAVTARAQGSAAADACQWQPPQGAWMTATCPVEAFGFARARVFSLRGRWPTGTEPSPDVGETYWLFERDGKPGPSLIIHFYRDGQAAVADLYDDADGDTWVRYAETVGGLTILEGSGDWTMRVRAPDGWWERDDKVNFNLDIEVVGPVIGMIDTPLYLHRLERNSRVNLVAHVRDSNQNGRPDYEWRQAYPPLTEDDAYYKSSVMVNTRDDEPELTGASPFWPYIGNRSYELVKPYFESPAPIQVEWDAGLIRVLGEFIASRGRPGNYFIYSVARIQPDQTTPVDFESPFAFYRFGDGDEYPDTLVRVAQAKAQSRWYLAEDGPLPVPLQEIDFSWRHRSDARLASRSGFEFGGVGYRWDRPKLEDLAPLWDFKVSVAGRHTISGRMDFPEFALDVVPYAELPTWVTERTWDFATFVAREGPGYPSSEGLYEWLPLESTHPKGARYLTGLSSASPQDRLEPLPPGFRGEFNFQYGRQPLVYLSPIDRRLHLLGAKDGYWNVDGTRFLRYRDLTGDGYLDQWTDEVGGQPRATLTVHEGQAVLAGEQSVQLQDLRALGSEAFRSPLTDGPETWRALRDELSPYDRLGEAEELPALLNVLPGSRATLMNATLRDYQSLRDGFVFALDLASDYELVDGDGAYPWLAGLAAGRYTVRYTADAGYRAQPLTPPDLELVSLAVASETVTPLRPAPLRVTVRNRGGEAANGVALILRGRLGEAPVIPVASMPIDVPGDGSATIPVLWSPPTAGDWRIQATIEGTPANTALLDIPVTEAPIANWSSLLQVQSIEGPYRGLVGLVLAAAMLAAGAVGLALWRGTGAALG
jgi:hypothetical protein